MGFIQKHGFWFYFLHHNQFFDVLVKKSDYEIKKLIMMLKLEPTIVGLKPAKIGHVDRVIIKKPKLCNLIWQFWRKCAGMYIFGRLFFLVCLLLLNFDFNEIMIYENVVRS